MADKKISELTSLPGSSLAATDELAVVDTSASETKKITAKEAVQYGYGLIDADTLDGDIIEPGTTTARGTVQLTDSTSSTSTTTAATPNSVKTAYDLANAALPKSGGVTTGAVGFDDGTAEAPSVYFTGSGTDTGIYSPGADQLALSTSGAGRVFIDANGNVGIGVNSPTRVFHAASAGSSVVGSLECTSQGFASFDLQNTAGYARFTSIGNAAVFSPGATEALRITSAGLVGIGTSAPADILHIGGSSDQQIRVNGSGAPIYIGSANSILNLAVNRRTSDGAIPDATKSAAYINLDGSGSSSVISFLTASAVNTQPTVKAVIDGSGRVGIGTTSPGASVESKTTTGTYAFLANATDNYISLNATSAVQIGSIDRTSGGNDIEIKAKYGGLAFWTGTAGTATQKAFIDSSGRLLVGTSSDSGGALLQVNGDRVRIATAKTPASASATGTAGEVCWDTNYIYVCTATNTWKRAALSTW